jgi:hypothetical protein
MTQHSSAFEIRRPIPAADALKDLPPTTRAPGGQTHSISTSCNGGRGGRGGNWCGLGTASTTGPSAVSGLDR